MPSRQANRARPPLSEGPRLSHPKPLASFRGTPLCATDSFSVGGGVSVFSWVCVEVEVEVDVGVGVGVGVGVAVPVGVF